NEVVRQPLRSGQCARGPAGAERSTDQAQEIGIMRSFKGIALSFVLGASALAGCAAQPDDASVDVGAANQADVVDPGAYAGQAPSQVASQVASPVENQATSQVTGQAMPTGQATTGQATTGQATPCEPAPIGCEPVGVPVGTPVGVPVGCS